MTKASVTERMASTTRVPGRPFAGLSLDNLEEQLNWPSRRLTPFGIRVARRFCANRLLTNGPNNDDSDGASGSRENAGLIATAGGGHRWRGVHEGDGQCRLPKASIATRPPLLFRPGIVSDSHDQQTVIADMETETTASRWRVEIP